jgi:hypothetical protein
MQFRFRYLQFNHLVNFTRSVATIQLVNFYAYRYQLLSYLRLRLLSSLSSSMSAFPPTLPVLVKPALRVLWP